MRKARYPDGVRSTVIQGSFPHGLPAKVRQPASRPPFAAQLQPRAPLQRTNVQPAAVLLPRHVAAVPSGGGHALPPAVRQKMEAYFGASFADVRVHVGPHAAAIGAHVFTRGSDIHFAPGQYDPHSVRGQEVLAHELTHVVQQRRGRVANPFSPAVAIVHDHALEAEASRHARAAAVQPMPARSVQCKWVSRGKNTWEDAGLGLIYAADYQQFVDATGDHGETWEGWDRRHPDFARNRARYVREIDEERRRQNNNNYNNNNYNNNNAPRQQTPPASPPQAFSGDIEDLDPNPTIAGIPMTYVQSGQNYIYKPADGRDYPHVTIIGTRTLNQLHFTSARYNATDNMVSVTRKGYRWDGMRSRLVDDPEFDFNEQLLSPSSVSGGQVTFALKGGRQGQTVAVTAAHVAPPSASKLAKAFGIS
jgi:hypothetical protein